MKILTQNPLRKIFTLSEMEMSIYLDRYSNLFWRVGEEHPKPLQTLPWKYQQAFYLTFLRDVKLTNTLKNMEIIGAIDLFIKGQYYKGEALELTNLSNTIV